MFEKVLLKLFPYPHRGFDYDALVETECNECFIRVSGFKDEPGEQFANVYLSQLSSHNNPSQLSWKWRMTRIKRIILGHPDPDYEINSADVLDQLINALIDCRTTIYGANDGNDGGNSAPEST